ncbi:hypothetical protein L950_0219260 [Sphingobacterium sp. IITKGP-BTPF85]|nr:hypothetical protein L950_0219260 [Sphingobacterium sp. IITKGP-BTPF85]
MDHDLVGALEQHIKEWQIKKRTKKYIDEAKELLLDFKRKREQLQQCLIIADALSKKDNFQEALEQVQEQSKTKEKEDLVVQSEEGESSKKLDTKQVTLELYKDGASIEEIAVKRGMVAGTIYGHLIHFVGTEVEATELIEQDKLDLIINTIKAHPGKSSSELKMMLGASIDYPHIKIGQKVLENPVHD